MISPGSELNQQKNNKRQRALWIEQWAYEHLDLILYVIQPVHAFSTILNQGYFPLRKNACSALQYLYSTSQEQN